MRTIILSIIVSIFMVSCGKDVQNPGGLETIELKENILNIGSEWSRLKVDKSKINTYSSNEKRLFKAVARVSGILGSGTAFYLGQHSGEYLFATNHHVMPTSTYCTLFTIIKLFNDKNVVCKKLLSSWPDVEIAFFTVRTNDVKVAELLEGIEPLTFEFSRHINSREPLMSAGFGVHNNPKKELTYINDKFCMVASRYKDYRRVVGPGALVSMISSREEKKTWTFMHGCEGSHGDSGSPLVSRRSGKVIGIYWGGKTPKGNRMLNDEYVEKTFSRRRDKIVWSKLNMGVPAHAILKKIKQYLDKNIRHNPTKKAIYESLID